MARLPRLTLPGHLHHVVHRGNDGQAICRDDQDFRFLHQLLAESSREHRVALHGYLLLPDRFHLLATPETGTGVGLLLQGIGRRFVRHVNDRHGRTGTLWEGRYRSTLLQPDAYLLPAMVLLDLEPVRRGDAARPADHPWSSHRHYAGLAPDRAVTPHALWWALGDTPFAREQAYLQRVEAGVAADTAVRIQDATQGGWALGDAAFIEGLSKLGARRPTPRTPGRPRKV